MKFNFVTTFLLLIFSISCHTQVNSRQVQCKEVIDSAKIFISTNYYGINSLPKAKNIERNLKIDKWLQQLPFNKLVCLLNSKSLGLKEVGFLYAAIKNKDSLLLYFSSLLSDTTMVQIFYSNNRLSTKVKFGEHLQTILQTLNDHEDDFMSNLSVDSILYRFINKYALYPASYKPISLTYFTNGIEESGIKTININHKFELKNMNGISQILTCSFILSKKLRLCSLEIDEISCSLSCTTCFEIWVKEFGRTNIE